MTAPGQVAPNTSSMAERSQQDAAVKQGQQAQQQQAMQQQKAGQAELYNSVPGITDQEAGIAGIGQAQSAGAIQEAGIYKTAAQQEAKHMADFQTENTARLQEIKDLNADIKAGHINPERYMESKSSGAKMNTAIGLILGGIGGGITGQANPALDYINKQIDRDLEAQKVDVSSKQNLLSALNSQYQNASAAEQMFMAMRKNQVADQIMAAASSAKSPLALAAAQKASGELQTSAIQNTMRASALKVENNNNADPASLVPYKVFDPAARSQVFKEIQDAQNMKKVRSELMSHWDKAAADTTVGGHIMRGSVFQSPSIHAIDALVLPVVKDLEGRVNEYEQQTIQALYPAMGDATATLAAKRKGLEQFVTSKMSAPTAKGYGIDLSKYNSTSSNPFLGDNTPAGKWASANPDSPEAQRYLKSKSIKK
jgi:hypothetical protein